MNIFQPSFLKKLDRHLLLNHRIVWATRIHYVLFYMPFAWLAAWGLTQLISIDTQNSLPEPTFYGLIAFVFASIGLLFWVYKQAEYSIERSFGYFKKEMEYLRMGVYFVVVSSFVGLPVWTGYWVLNHNASLISTAQLAQEVEKLNDGNIFFPDENSNIYDLIDCWAGNTPLPEVESVVSSDCMDKYQYNWFTANDYYMQSSQISPESLSMKIRQLWNMPEEEQAKMAQEYLSLVAKYGGDISNVPADPIGAFKRREIDQLPHWEKNTASNHISEIQRYNKQYEQIEWYSLLGFLGCFVFALTILVQLYNGIGLKNFIVSAATTVLISISTLFVSALLIGEGRTIFVSAFFVYVFMLVVALGAKSATRYSFLQVTALAFATFFTPFVLLLISLLLNNDEAFTLVSAAIAGCILHAIFFAPLFWSLQAHVQALPRKN